jgi:hypothetical protein
MKTYKELVRITDSKTFRGLVKDFDIDDLKNSFSLDLQLWTDLFLSHKMFLSELYDLYQSESDKSMLVDSMIIAEFLPERKFIDGIVKSLNNELLNKLLVKFPSVKFGVKDLVSMINSGMIDSAVTLVKNSDQLQNKEIFNLLLKNKLSDEELLSIIFNSDILPSILNDIDSEISRVGLDQYSDRALSLFIIHAGSEKVNKLHSFVDDVLKRDIDINSMQVFIENANFISRSYGRQSDIKKIIYNVKYEAYPALWFKNILVEETPKLSKLRELCILIQSSIGDVGELKSILEKVFDGYLNIDSMKIKSLIYAFIQKTDVNNIDCLDINFIEKKFSPAELSDCLIGKVDIAIKLYPSLSYKHQKRLREHLIPKKDMPEEFNKKKKSYFMEVLDCIKNSDVDGFRDYLNNYGYNLDKFSLDCHQSSKVRLCENIYIKDVFFKSLDVEEISALITTPMRVSLYLDDADDGTVKQNPFNFKVTYEFAKKLYAIFGNKDILYLCEDLSDKIKLLSFMDLSEYDLKSFISEEVTFVNANPEFKDIILEKIKSMNSFDLDSDYNEFLINNLSKDEISHLAKNSSNHSLILNIDLKDSEDNFIFDIDEVKKIIADVGNTYSNYVESLSFLNALSKRDSVLAKEWAVAYLKGNKFMTEVLGYNISIRRSGKDIYQEFLNIEEKGVDSIIDEILSRGSLFSEWKETFSNYKQVLKKLDKGTVVNVSVCKLDALDTFICIPNINFKIKSIKITRFRDSDNLDEIKCSNIMINSLVIPLRFFESSYYNDEESKISKLEEFIKYFSIDDIIAENISLTEAVKIKDSFLFDKLNCKKVIDDYIASGEGLTKNIMVDNILFDYGFNFNQELFEEFILSNLAGWGIELDYLKFLEKKLGGIKGMTVTESLYKSRFNRDKESEDLIKAFLDERGFNIVSKKEFDIINTKNRVRKESIHFRLIDMKEFSLDEKKDMLFFIEHEIDSRFSELELKSFNLDRLDSIENFSVMKTMTSLNEDDIINILNIPNNIKSNKKIISGIIDLMTLNSGNFIYKVYMCKQLFDKMECKDTLIVSDLVDYSNTKDIKQSESFENINVESLIMIESKLDSFKDFFLKGKGKKQILRFLRSASQPREVEDTFDLMNQVVKGKYHLEESLKDCDKEDIERFDLLKESIHTLQERFNEVISMDNLTHMHDRLIPLAKFIKEDPTQPIGLNKFANLNKKDLEKELGNNLYFPQTRGEVQFLGDTYGWCVTGAGNYTRGILEKGNVLIGICEKGMSACKENVIALAHFNNNGKGQFSLEQLRWSKQKKNGERNVSATSNFNYKRIIGYIENHLIEKAKDKK